MIRTRIAVARPAPPGSSPPGSETSIQNRAVSIKRFNAVSPAYAPVNASGLTIELSVYPSSVSTPAKLKTAGP